MIRKAKYEFAALTTGGDYEETFRFLQSDSTPWDLTGCTFSAVCRETSLKTSQTLFVFDTDYSEPSEGIVRLRVSREVTSQIPITGYGFCDLKILGTDGFAFYYISGRIPIEDGLS